MHLWFQVTRYEIGAFWWDRDIVIHLYYE